MTDEDPELDYLRTVEDLFSALRGVPHMLSPKDIQLARRLWGEGVSPTAVSAGVSEVIDRRRQSGDPAPVTSLSYCRHAIRRHARRLTEQNVGASDSVRAPDAEVLQDEARELIQGLLTVTRQQAEVRPQIAEAVARVARELEAAIGQTPAAFESLAFDLERALLESCWSALPADEQTAIQTTSDRAAEASGATGAARQRAFLAFRDREIRALLSLPRLELR